jgi:hypothetical protein
MYAAVYDSDIDLLRIVVPERLNLSFTGYITPEEEAPVSDAAEKAVIVARLGELTEMQTLIDQAKTDSVITFQSSGEILVRNAEHAAITEALGTSSIRVAEALSSIDV